LRGNRKALWDIFELAKEISKRCTEFVEFDSPWDHNIYSKQKAPARCFLFLEYSCDPKQATCVACGGESKATVMWASERTRRGREHLVDLEFKDEQIYLVIRDRISPWDHDVYSKLGNEGVKGRRPLCFEFRGVKCTITFLFISDVAAFTFICTYCYVACYVTACEKGRPEKCSWPLWFLSFLVVI